MMLSISFLTPARAPETALAAVMFLIQFLLNIFQMFPVISEIFAIDVYLGHDPVCSVCLMVAFCQKYAPSRRDTDLSWVCSEYCHL
jgi:hypothetical protein